jgi:hypothetical protein
MPSSSNALGIAYALSVAVLLELKFRCRQIRSITCRDPILSLILLALAMPKRSANTGLKGVS